MNQNNYKRILTIVIAVLALIPLCLIIRSFQASVGQGFLSIALLAGVIIAYYFLSKPDWRNRH